MINIEEANFTQSLVVIDELANFDVILGQDWFHDFNPNIDFDNHVVHLKNGSFRANGQSLPDSLPDSRTDAASLRFISGKRAVKDLRRGCDGFFGWVELTEPESISASKPSIETDASNRQQVEEVLEEFKDCFPETLPSGLPPHREVDHEIDLESGHTPPSRPAYRLSQPEMQELEKQISNLLEHGYIQPSRSPYGAPVFFVRKKDGSFRLVCDWRQLNKITMKNKACLPNPEDLFDTVQGSRFFHQIGSCLWLSPGSHPRL